MTPAVQAAIDVAALLADAEFEHLPGTPPDEPEISRAYRPVYVLPNIKGLRISVLPAGHSTSPETRGGRDRHEIQISVAVQRKLDNPDDPAECDAMVMLVEEVRQTLNRVDLPSGMRFVGSTWEPLYWPGHLRRFGVFTAALTITYLGMADVGGGD